MRIRPDPKARKRSQIRRYELSQRRDRAEAACVATGEVLGQALSSARAGGPISITLETQFANALILAGRRGKSDPFAESVGASHRALIPVAGVPMLLRVVRTLAAMPELSRLTISIDVPELIEPLPDLAALESQKRVAYHRSLPSPSRSVQSALDASGTPLLVTTADHALLEAEIVRYFLREARARAADVAVGLVERSVIETRFPAARRTYIRLRGGAYSGANLFAFLTPEARRAAEFWVRAERFRKQPWRLAQAFGPTALLLFVLRQLDLDGAIARVSRAIGARVSAILLPFAEAAVDVDKAADLELANEILRDRGERAAPPTA
jgi:GTP:adenosylcobinamide-phosphate guanylyltransferase